MHWRTWLRTCSNDSCSPGRVPKGSLAMLTGQDTRALEAIHACWELYSSSDADGQRAALSAAGSLLGGMQPKCRFLAKELIAMSLDWGDRERVWLLALETL